MTPQLIPSYAFAQFEQLRPLSQSRFAPNSAPRGGKPFVKSGIGSFGKRRDQRLQNQRLLMRLRLLLIFMVNVEMYVYVNSPLSESKLDQRREPLARYARNEVRTSSKYYV